MRDPTANSNGVRLSQNFINGKLSSKPATQTEENQIHINTNEPKFSRGSSRQAKLPAREFIYPGTASSKSKGDGFN